MTFLSSIRNPFVREPTWTERHPKLTFVLTITAIALGALAFANILATYIAFRSLSLLIPLLLMAPSSLSKLSSQETLLFSARLFSQIIKV